MRERQAIQAVLTRVLLRARESDAAQVKRVQIAVGEISELDRPVIQQHWDELSHGTAAERARLDFRLIEAEVQCMACFQKYHPVERKIHCPYCGSYGAKVLSGEEFHLESIELES